MNKVFRALLTALTLSVAAGVSPAVEPGVSPGGMGTNFPTTHHQRGILLSLSRQAPNESQISPISISPNSYPGGILDNSPAFQRWVWTLEGSRPDGTADTPLFQPSLRDLVQPNLCPSVETLGYSRASLRDEQNQILVALGGPPAPTNLVIGLLLRQTEPLSLSVHQGVLLGVEHWKESTHLPGHLVIRGAVGQWGTDGVEAARMVTDDGAQGLIAPPDGAGSHLSLQVSGRTATPVISLCADSSVTQTGVPWTARIAPRMLDEAKSIFSGLSTTAKTWVACVPDGRRGREIARDLTEAAQESEISLPKPMQVKWPTADLRAFTTQLLTNRADGILLWLDPIPAASLLQLLRAA